jgi:hypothetical protein
VLRILLGGGCWGSSRSRFSGWEKECNLLIQNRELCTRLGENDSKINVMQLTLNQRVPGSSPGAPTIKSNTYEDPSIPVDVMSAMCPNRVLITGGRSERNCRARGKQRSAALIDQGRLQRRSG